MSRQAILVPPSVVSQPFFSARLPLPPGVNKSYKIVSIPSKAKGRVIHRLAASPELEQFKQDAIYLLRQPDQYHDYPIITKIRESYIKVPLHLELIFYFTTLWKKDEDGGIKAVQDAVFQHLQLNDNLVIDLHVQKRVDRDDPRVEISLSCVLTTD